MIEKKKASCVVIYRKLPLGEILVYLGRRCSKRDIGQWENCGGKVDPEETDLEAAIRECREETGVYFPSATDDDLFGFFTRDVGNIRWLNALYAFEWKPGMVNPSNVEPHVIDRTMWIDIDDLHTVELTPDSKIMLEIFERDFL